MQKDGWTVCALEARGKGRESELNGVGGCIEGEFF